MPNADNYKLLNKTAILVLLTQINLHQISKQEYKRISVSTQPWIPNSQDTVFSRGMIKFCGQRQRHKGQVSIISSTDPCVLANHLLWVCNIPLLLLVSNSQTQMPPPCTENKHLSSGLEYLYKIKEKKKKKAKETSEQQQGGHNTQRSIIASARSRSTNGSSLPAALYAKICRDPEILLFTQQECTAQKAAPHFLNCPANYQQFLSSEDQAAGGFENSDFIPHFTAREGIFPPCKLGGLKIVQAGSRASK